MSLGTSPLVKIVFAFFVLVVVGISFYLGRKANSAKGFYAAHGQIPWFVNGVAFAGDYLSAASFLGICGLIAFYGYDGFLYSIGFLAGWIVALFVIAEPLKRLGRFTFADALDSRFHSRGIKLAAAISTLVVSIFYLIPQMVGAGSLIKPLFGWDYSTGVMIVGAVVTVIVVTAGMVSTTWVQFIKGSLLVALCAILTVAILARGLTTDPYQLPDGSKHRFVIKPASEVTTGAEVIAPEGAWKDKPYVRIRAASGQIQIWRKDGDALSETQSIVTADKQKPVVNGETGFLWSVGNLAALPEGKTETGPLGPIEYLSTIQKSTVTTWANETIVDADTHCQTKIFYQQQIPGSEVMMPGLYFKGIHGQLPAIDPNNLQASTAKRSKALLSRIDFVSLMIALFCGTAALPHILIRYYTVKDQVSARKSTVVGIAVIGFFYILTLFLGLGAMTSGMLRLDDTNMSAPMLARSFGELPFACISAIAFTTVLGTVSGLIMAASGAIVHDLITNVLRVEMDDHLKVRAGKVVALLVGIISIVLGILFQKMNTSFLVGWAFNIAASANLPALIMLLFWRGTTKQGITWAIVIGLLSSLGWVLGSKEAYQNVYQYSAADAATYALVPFSQPAIITVPLGFLVLVVVSLLTRHSGTAEALQRKRVAVAGTA